MIYTARQLEDLQKANGNGQIVLPYGARLTPLAADWAKSRKVAIGYSNVEPPKPAPRAVNDPSVAGRQSGGLLWWCDGPCGAAKAALTAQAKESALSVIDEPANAKNLVKVIKLISGEVKSGKASGGVLLVSTAAAAMVMANRCPSLRAIVGTCLESVEQGIRQVGANVLIVEYPYKTLSQVKNMLGRFARWQHGGQREISDDVKRQLQELASCG
jgi:hypothetical protein